LNLIKTDKVNATPRELKKFGIMFGAVCLVLAAYAFFKGSAHWQWFAGGAAFFLLTGLFGHAILRPLYIGWMKFAFVLGWINTRVLLGLFFYGVVTPIGVAMRLFGKDLLDQKINRSAATYWIRREKGASDPKRCERMF
jgi:hypothetical protein